jgi:hypothetical protein
MNAFTGTHSDVQLYNIGQPSPDDASTEIAALHWAVRAMKASHPAFPFMVGVLRHAVEFGHCTNHQLDAAGRVVRRLRAEMAAEFGE